MMLIVAKVKFSLNSRDDLQGLSRIFQSRYVMVTLQYSLQILFCNGENVYCTRMCDLILSIPGCKSNPLNKPTVEVDVEGNEVQNMH